MSVQDPYHTHSRQTQQRSRVAIVTTSYPSHAMDWVGHFVRAEALELAAAGCEVTVLSPRAAFAGDAHVRIHAGLSVKGSMSAFGPPGALARIAAFPPRAISAARFASRARAALRDESFDRVIAHWAVPCAWPIGVGVCASLDVVSHGGDVRALLALPSIVRQRIVSAITREASAWRFVSESLRDALADALDSRLRERVISIATVRPASMRLADVEARARDLRATLGAFDVSVGRLLASKRVDKAIARAAARGDLLCVIGDGPERRALERQAARTSANVRFLGDLPRDEALAYVAAANALVFGSEAEGASTVVREAHALETRVDFL